VVLHAHPFPELIERMRAAGLRNYSIFLRDYTLFAYYEYIGDDFEADTAAMAENDTVQDWWTLTDPMQEPLEAREEGEWWASMDALYQGGERTVPVADAERVAFEHTYREGTVDEVDAAYAESADELDSALGAVPVQRYTVYRLGSRCFTYVEYVGDDVEGDLRRLRKHSALQSLQSALTSLQASTDAKEGSSRMESVFFMA
jgi:L-rhamnose mutarotase